MTRPFKSALRLGAVPSPVGDVTCQACFSRRGTSRGNRSTDCFLLVGATPTNVGYCFNPYTPQRQLLYAGRAFRQSLMGETPKTALAHHRTGSPTPYTLFL